VGDVEEIIVGKEDGSSESKVVGDKEGDIVGSPESTIDGAWEGWEDGKSACEGSKLGDAHSGASS